MMIARTAARISLAAILTLGAAPGQAQDWNPFKEQDERARQEKAARQPAGRSNAATAPPYSSDRDFTPGEVTRGTLPPLNANAVPVERGGLQPLPSAYASGLPAELWQGLEVAEVEQHLTRLEAPLRSPALLDLWRRMWRAPAGDAFTALRIETLLRHGQIATLREQLSKASPTQAPAAVAMEVRARIGLGDRERGCAGIRAIVRQISELPKLARADALLISGYCALVEKNTAAASVAAELARDQKAGASTGLAVLDALVAGTKHDPPVPGPISLIDYRFLELAGAVDAAKIVERATGPLLALLATQQGLDANVRILAMEASGQPNAFDPDLLGEVYKAAFFEPSQLADPTSAGVPAQMKRALLFKAAEAERRAAEKGRLMRMLMDEAKSAGRLLPTAAALGSTEGDMQPSAEAPAFGETMVQTLLAAGRTDHARRWAAQGGASLQHWLALADVAEPRSRGQRDTNLAVIEELAARGTLSSDLLHRLATVLDALDVLVPIPLWEAASRTPQPDGGHLPETGVLSQLQDAAKKKEVARTILLAMRAVGPNGAEGAHMIALGDAIRALKRVGLEREARQLGFEALFPVWPRLASADR